MTQKADAMTGTTRTSFVRHFFFSSWTRSTYLDTFSEPAWRRGVCQGYGFVVGGVIHFDERLQKLPLFVPEYAKTPNNMYYIMSMEYSRMWYKEKDEWFKNVFKSNPKQQDILDRRRKLRKEFLEAKRQAEIKIQERKERMAKEKEIKLKMEAEEMEKTKERVRKLRERLFKKPKEKAAKKTSKEYSKDKTSKEPKPAEPETTNEGTCPEGWKQVELTLQCECQGNNKEDTTEESEESKNEGNQPAAPTQATQPESARTEIKQACPAECMENQVAEAVTREQRKEDEEPECAYREQET